MEFWGVEVKPGQTLLCSAGEDRYTHLSQIALGEGSKSDERVAVYIHMNGKKIMIGSCLRGSCDQFGLDLILEKDFNVSHTSKTATIFCSGYTTFIQEEDEDNFGGLNDEDEDDEDDESESDDDMEITPSVLTTKENGNKQPGKPEKAKKLESGSVAMPGKPKGVLKVKPEAPKQPAKVVDDDESDDEELDDYEVVMPGKPKGVPKVKPEAPKQPAKVDDDDESDEEESDDDEVEDMDDVSGSEDDEDDSDEDEDEDDEDESDEETPKAPVGKKRPAPDSVTKTPVTDKKSKIATPEGHKPGDNKKNVHVATPHPGAKQGKKKGKETPGGPNQQTPVSKETPKSNASTPATMKKFACQSCQKNFNSEPALLSHNAAKHSAK